MGRGSEQNVWTPSLLLFERRRINEDWSSPLTMSLVCGQLAINKQLFVASLGSNTSNAYKIASNKGEPPGHGKEKASRALELTKKFRNRQRERKKKESFYGAKKMIKKKK